MKEYINKIKKFSKKDFFLKIALPLFAGWMLFNTILGLIQNPKRKTEEPIKPVSISVYDHNIAGNGITEPQSETINIGTDLAGIVSKIYVQAGDIVRKDQELFSIDERIAKANVNLKNASYKASKIQTLDAKSQLDMLKKLTDLRAISKDEMDRKKYAFELAKQREEQAKAELDLAKVDLDKSTIKSPIDGQILKVNVRPGEYVTNNPVSTKTLISVGDLTKMNVRVEIDESETYRFKNGAPATAMLKGNPSIKIPLEFVRIEPLVVAKTSLTGNSTEKVDTRVLQIIYSFDNSKLGILVGQEMDVYIKSER